MSYDNLSSVSENILKFYQQLSVARIICVAVATLANEKLLKCASDHDLLLCRKSTSNKTRCRQ
jgi:hypothetical protein